jgi:peptide/nickel transport system substrate-binding protein
MSQAADIQPAFAPYSLVTYNQFLYSLVYDTLVSYDANLNPQPGLATSWEWSPDFLQLTLKLRAGVKFHSGRPFTSADARFNLERLRDPAANSQLLNYAREMQVETPDPGTLVIKYSAPARSSFDALAAALMADSQTLDQLREGHGFVGTGAFRFKEWMQGDHFTVQRNQDYWQPGRPYLDQVEVRIAADPQSALVFLETGSLDWMSGVPAQDALRLKVTQIISCFSTVAVAFFTTWASMSAAPP